MKLELTPSQYQRIAGSIYDFPLVGHDQSGDASVQELGRKYGLKKIVRFVDNKVTVKVVFEFDNEEDLVKFQMLK